MHGTVQTNPLKPVTYMARARINSIFVIGIGLWLSGAAWLLLHYFMLRQTDFGPQHDPLEHWSIVAHGAFAFAAIWIFGLLWGTHIVKRWKAKRHRWSGSLLFAFLALLVVSGYLLYYVGDDQLRELTSKVHWIVGLGLPLPFVLHWLVRMR
jgi:hypothetical protein